MEFKTKNSPSRVGRGRFCSKKCFYLDQPMTVSRYRRTLKDGRYIYLHQLAAEAALGRRLPKAAEIHHVNGNRFDNRGCKLVICEDSSYHKLLHMRAKTLRLGGNPNTQRWCSACKRLRLITEMSMRDGRPRSSCRECDRAYDSARRKRMVA